jgi:cation diffusion facilitator family transporter
MDSRRAPVRAASISVLLGVAVFGLKSLAAWRTSSLTLLSDALESVVNVVAAGIALGAIRFAARPADANHPFGHAKIEYFSAGIEGALVVLASVTIAWQAVTRFGSAPRIPELGLGLAVSALATIVNFGLSVYLERAGLRHRSPALLADALHVRSDVWTSVGAYLGFGVAWATQRWELDALVALAVAGHILGAGIRAMRGSFGGLMDEGLPGDEVAAIDRVVGAEPAPVIEHHDLRTRRAGSDLFVEFHLVVAGATPVRRAHDICDRLEAAIRELHPGARVTIHVEPEAEARLRPEGPEPGTGASGS